MKINENVQRSGLAIFHLPGERRGLSQQATWMNLYMTGRE